VEGFAKETEPNIGLQHVMLKAGGVFVGSGYNSCQIRTRSQDGQHSNAKQTPGAQEASAVRTLETATVEGFAKETEPNIGLQPVALKAGGAFVGSGYTSSQIRMRSQDRQDSQNAAAATALGAATACVQQPANSRTVIDTTEDMMHEEPRLSPTRCKAAAIAADRLREDDTSSNSKPLQDCNMATRAIARHMQNSDDEQVTATAGDTAEERLHVESCRSAAIAADLVREDDSTLSSRPLQENNMAKRAIASHLQNSDDESATAR